MDLSGEADSHWGRLVERMLLQALLEDELPRLLSGVVPVHWKEDVLNTWLTILNEIFRRNFKMIWTFVIVFFPASLEINLINRHISARSIHLNQSWCQKRTKTF